MQFYDKIGRLANDTDRYAVMTLYMAIVLLNMKTF